MSGPIGSVVDERPKTNGFEGQPEFGAPFQVLQNVDVVLNTIWGQEDSDTEGVDHWNHYTKVGNFEITLDFSYCGDFLIGSLQTIANADYFLFISLFNLYMEKSNFKITSRISLLWQLFKKSRLQQTINYT